MKKGKIELSEKISKNSRFHQTTSVLLKIEILDQLFSQLSQESF